MASEKIVHKFTIFYSSKELETLNEEIKEGSEQPWNGKNCNFALYHEKSRGSRLLACHSQKYTQK